jgi:TRAP-type C4-dicarboxylate transport system permease small subunit
MALVRLSDPRPLPMTGVPSSFAAAALPVAYGLMFVTVIEQILRHLRGLPESDDAEAGREVM